MRQNNLIFFFQVRSINQSCGQTHIMIIIETLTPAQKLITFSGLLSVANCLSENLELKIIESSRDKESPRNFPFLGLKSKCISPSFIGDIHGIRIRIMNSQTVWSGEIPLNFELTKDSLSVKIPLKIKGESMTVLCRVLRQRVSNIWRILVVLSPQFVLRSHLPRPLILHLTTPSTHTTTQVYCFLQLLTIIFIYFITFIFTI